MTAPGAGTPAATAPGRSLGDDWPAIAAHAAHHDIVNPAEALASWRALSESRRVAWRASADAVVMLLDAKASDSLTGRVAELGAEGNELRGLVAEILDVLSGSRPAEVNQFEKWQQRAGLSGSPGGGGGRDAQA